VTIYPFDDSFDNATFALEGATLDQGLMIGYISHTSPMLATKLRF
jgi:hypothetical protein